MRQTSRFDRSIIACAVALWAGGLLPAHGAIVSVGEVNPDPSSGTVLGRLSIGSAGSGSLTVNAGSSLAADVIGLGDQPTGIGSLSVTGFGSSVALAASGSNGNLDIGGAGSGSVSVLSGASFIYGVAGNACALNCRLWISNGAGSQGSVLLNGTGSSLSTPGQITVGNASVFTLATDGFDYGAPGGASQGSLRIEAGASASSSRLIIANAGGGLGRNGLEQSTGSVVVDGIGSVLTVLRNATQTAGSSLLRLASGANTHASLDIQNGGRVRVDGNAALNLPLDNNLFAGASIGLGGPGSSAVVRVDGAGSRLEVAGPLGFINVGLDVAGSSGQLQVSNGGVVTGVGTDGLPFLTVGRNGGTGTLTVSGTDNAGNASTVRLAGRNPGTDGGAFMSVGRNDGTGAGIGTVNVTGGGRIEIDTVALTLTNPNGQTGMYIGVGAGSSGTLGVSGNSAVTGAASSFAILAGSGLTPYVGIGRDGATGTVNITGGGKLTLSSSHVSVPNAGTYLPGDALIVDIGRRGGSSSGTGASTGTLTISGAGSELSLLGSADRLVQVGIGNNANGTLNITAGGKLSSGALLVGQTNGIGSLTLNNGLLELNGQLNGGPAAGQGGGLVVGRGSGGVGVANIGNASTVTISSPLPLAALTIGGTGTGGGGTGKVNLSGASTVTITGPDALFAVGRNGAAGNVGIGTATLSGNGTSVTTAGAGAKVLVGAAANTVGTLVVGAGSSLSATTLIGVAHDGSADTGGIGTLVVNGSATAGELHVGSAGVLGGSGVVNANVFNHGVIGPGNSPGRLTVNGNFDNSNGKIVLEIAAAGGGFQVDEIVFTQPGGVLMGAGQIEFVFDGATDPNAFFGSGQFNLASFFKVQSGGGPVLDLPDEQLHSFDSTQFSARADTYVFNSFSFDPQDGASFSASPVPQPPSVMLMLAGLLLMAGTLKARAR